MRTSTGWRHWLVMNADEPLPQALFGPTTGGETQVLVSGRNSEAADWGLGAVVGAGLGVGFATFALWEGEALVGSAGAGAAGFASVRSAVAASPFADSPSDSELAVVAASGALTVGAATAAAPDGTHARSSQVTKEARPMSLRRRYSLKLPRIWSRRSRAADKLDKPSEHPREPSASASPRAAANRSNSGLSALNCAFQSG